MRSFGRLLIKGTLYNVKEVEKMRKYVTKHNNVAKMEKWSRGSVRVYVRVWPVRAYWDVMQPCLKGN